MEKLEKLVREVRKIDKNLKKGDRIEMLYGSECVAAYDFDGERTIDLKTPEEWLRGCFCFEISLRNRDAKKVNIRLVSHG